MVFNGCANAITNEVIQLEKKVSELKLKLNLGDKTDYKSYEKTSFGKKKTPKAMSKDRQKAHESVSYTQLPLPTKA